MAAAMARVSARSINAKPLIAGTSSSRTTGAVDELLAGTESVSLPETVAVLVIVPATWPVPWMVMVAVAPLGIVPRLQVTVVVPLQEPCVGVAVASVKLAGRGSVTVTPVAVLGPWLVTTRV